MVAKMKRPDPTFGTHATRNRDHFSAPLFRTSLKKTPRNAKMAQILGPENGHVFETERSQKCDREGSRPIALGNEFRRV